MSECFLNGRVILHCGDCRELIAGIEDNSIDSVVTDPPYALASIVKRFANSPRSERTENTENPYGRTGRGFMGQRWDVADVAFDPAFWSEVLRVLKPGGYCVAFGGSRTYHRLACAIEDAGFITHPLIAWVFGQGFPKAHSVSKHIDRMAGAEREVVETGAPVKRMIPGADQNKQGWEKNNGRVYVPNESIPATDAAKQWDGWFYGTQSLKPALEPIYCGQKPFERGLNGTQNILKWGTGALNIDACRVENVTVEGGTLAQNTHLRASVTGSEKAFKHSGIRGEYKPPTNGRWPANLCHDGSEEVLAAFPSPHGAGFARDGQLTKVARNIYGNDYGLSNARIGDSGIAARFFKQVETTEYDQQWAQRLFYTSKAGQDDRLGASHPTVKPLDLIQYLIRLITPPGGIVLDCFAGTGTVGEAAWREGMRAVLIEREQEYQEDIRRRMELAMAGPNERMQETMKQKHKGKPMDAGPLFAWGE